MASPVLLRSACILALGAGCAPTPPAPVPPAAEIAPTPPSPAPTALSEPPPGPPADSPIVELAPYRSGSGDLLLRGDDLYWAERWVGSEPDFELTGGVLECGRTRGAIRTVSRSGGAHRTVTRTGDWPWDIRVFGQHFYWLTWCTSELWRAPVAGGEPVRLAGERPAPHGYRIRGDSLFIVDRFGSAPGLYGGPVGGPLSPIAGAGEQAAMLGADDEHLFVAFERGAGWEISELQHDGGGARVLGTVPGLPLEAELRGRSLYLRLQGQIVVVAIDEPLVEPLAQLSAHPDRAHMAVTDSHVYWPNREGTISRVGVGGGPIESAVIGGQPSALRIDATSVYWLDRSRHRVMRAGRATLVWRPGPTD